MEKYANLSGDSDILSYEIGEDYIDVVFSSRPNVIYRYSYSGSHKENVEKMKELAQAGKGLNSFINEYCRYSYSNKSI
ncbi:MAG: hypothetical protein J5656_05805 [Clostridia bacterium]|nr:hypothetical protein [Clostridia bacterium]